MAVARAVTATAFLFGFTAGARGAWGGALSAEFSVTRGPGVEDCPDATALRTRVEQIMGRPLAAVAAAEPTLAVRVEFARAGDRHSAALRTRGAKEGERLLEDQGPTCAALAEAVGVTLALLLDRGPGRDIATAPPRRSPEGPSSRTSIVWIGISAGPVFGETPGVSLGFGPALGVELEHWSLELGGTEVLSRSAPFASGAVRVGLTSGDLQLCRMIDVAGKSLRAGVCGRAAAGQYRAEGEGYPLTTSARLPWLAGGAGVRMGGLWGEWLLWSVSGLLLLPVRRQTFSVDNAGVGYQSGAIGGTLAVELGVRLR